MAEKGGATAQRDDVPARTYTYGPVPSRRLGRSLGIDLVPFKTCSYDCVYCQLGRTTDRTVRREHYIPAADAIAEVRAILDTGERPDVIALAGSGEPTLHAGIGELIRMLKELTDVPVAVLTNGSLLWMPEVAEALLGADVVIPSLDAGDEEMFQLVNRPHDALSYERMVDGIASFSDVFDGRVPLEVVLLEGLTGTPEHVAKIAAQVERIRPDVVQLNTAFRPPAEAIARPLSTEELERLASSFPCATEVIASPAPSHSVTAKATGVDEARILALLRRRPCTIADIAQGLGAHAADVVKHVEALMASGTVTTLVRDGRTYFAPTHAEDPSV